MAIPYRILLLRGTEIHGDEPFSVVARNGMTWQSRMVNDSIVVRNKNSCSKEKNSMEVDFSLSLRAKRDNLMLSIVIASEAWQSHMIKK